MFPDRSQQLSAGGSAARPVVRPDFGTVAPSPTQIPVSVAVQTTNDPIPQSAVPVQVAVSAPAPAATLMPISAPAPAPAPTTNFVDLRTPNRVSASPATPASAPATDSNWRIDPTAPPVELSSPLPPAPTPTALATPVSLPEPASPVTAQPQPVQSAPSPSINPLAVSVDDHEPDLENLLASFTSEKKPEPSAPTQQPDSDVHPVIQKIREPKKLLRGAAAVAVMAVVVLGGFGLYRGYTHNTPYVGIAAPTPLTPAKDQLKQATAMASNFAQQSGDAARVATLKALHEQLEKYYVEKGYYPSVYNMQDLNWLATNFKGFDMTSLKDPVGSVAGLMTKPAVGQYAYQAGTDVHLMGCDNSVLNCNYYILTATMSNGKAYTSVALQ